MRLDYVKSESTIRPESIDTTSSATTVYLRRNIVEKTRETGGEETTYFEYEEAALSKDEYERYLDELAVEDVRQQRADIDYIALMTGVEL